MTKTAKKFMEETATAFSDEDHSACYEVGFEHGYKMARKEAQIDRMVIEGLVLPAKDLVLEKINEVFKECFPKGKK